MVKNNEKGLLDDLAYMSGKKSKDDYRRKSYKKKKNSSYKPPKLSTQIRIAEGYKQAVVKVTNYGRCTSKVSAHLSYISRNYTLSLEDQDAMLIKNKDEAEIILKNWDDIYFDSKENSRNTVHITFSVPEGSKRDDFNHSIREFLNDEYRGRNDYLFVQHDDTKHPHSHAVIVMRSIQGDKLDPRKEYLHHLRDKFAKKCRENGIKVDASRRFERGLSGRSRHSSKVQMHKQRGVIPKQDLALYKKIKEGKDDFKNKNINRNSDIKKHYQKTADNLIKEHSSDGNKLKAIAADKILKMSKSLPCEVSEYDLLKEYLCFQKEKGIGDRELSKKEKNIRINHKKNIDFDIE